MNSADMMPFKDVVSQLSNQYLRNAQSHGKKVVCFFCSYVPPELLHAAGVVPYRIKGMPGRDIGLGTTYLSSRICTFCRNTLSLALEGEFSFIDGIIGCNTCDHIRRTTQNWIIKNPPEFHTFLHVPRAKRDENISFYQDELILLKEYLESWLDIRIEDCDIASSIIIYNRARSILREISDLRKQDKPALTGAEMLCVSLAFHMMPVEDFINAAEKLLESRKTSSGFHGDVRILLTGSMIDEPDYV